MTIKSGQRMYRVRGPDGLWIRKGADSGFFWVRNEEMATFWRKLSHLKRAISGGIFQDECRFDGLPLAALQVVEYVIDIKRTRRKERLTEITNFHEEDTNGTTNVHGVDERTQDDNQGSSGDGTGKDA